MQTQYQPPQKELDVHRIDLNRRAIFRGVVNVLQRYAEVERTQIDRHASIPVWAHGVSLGCPTATIAPDGGHLRVAWSCGLVVSIALRLGDCRIGLIIPQNGIPDAQIISAFSPYADDRHALAPQRIIRPLGDSDTLVDFVFAGERLGDLLMTRRALCGDEVDMLVLADGFAQETIHLARALVHHLAVHGIYFGDAAQAEAEPILFFSADPHVARALNLTPAQILRAGDGDVPGTHKWMALVPASQRHDFEMRLQALSHAEFLDRQRNENDFDFDGLMLRASSGVYHPGPGSSTRFLVEALASDPLFPAGQDSTRVLDLGSGTGAVALWIRKHYPHCDVFGSDVDPLAVEDSKINAQRNALSVDFVQADLLDGLPAQGYWRAPFDRIVWNYPFWQVRRSPGVEFDHIAIDENGEMLRRLFEQIGGRLKKPGGMLYITYSTLANQPLLHQLCKQADMTPHLIAEDQSVNGFQRQVWRIGFSQPAPQTP
jgi:methylase of polypeptide subunit release factors